MLKIKPATNALTDFIYTGGYPRLYSINKPDLRQQWLKDYISTYIEKDLRDLAQIADLDIFQKAYKLLAYQTSQLINYTNIANDLGISVSTVKKYISILETSYQCKTLKPFLISQKKQLIKTPTVYFFDTGIIQFLMAIESQEQMINGGSWENSLETFVFSEIYKEIKDLALASVNRNFDCLIANLHL